MSYRDIMVFVDGSDSGRERARFAIGFARRNKAFLTILAFAPDAIVFAYGEPGIIAAMPDSYFDDRRKQAEELLEEVETEAQKQEVRAETRLIEGYAGDLAAVIGEQARYADLTIVGQPQEGAMWSSRGEVIARLLMGSGRPVLVVPYVGVAKGAEEPAIIMAAWDGSAEATRAFHDALPLLRSARKTILYIAEPAERAFLHGDEPGAAIARHLSRHGAVVEVRQAHSEELAIGDLILSHAASESADLIVMGGFHHSRLRELLIGGVTRTILEQMSVPVFMSH